VSNTAADEGSQPLVASGFVEAVVRVIQMRPVSVEWYADCSGLDMPDARRCGRRGTRSTIVLSLR